MHASHHCHVAFTLNPSKTSPPKQHHRTSTKTTTFAAPCHVPNTSAATVLLLSNLHWTAALFSSKPYSHFRVNMFSRVTKGVVVGWT